MKRNEALELARSLLRPAGALGDLVTRGPGWPPPEQCGHYKKAVGRVAGHAYCLLTPIWDEHPSLNPGGAAPNADPLELSAEPHPPETDPAGLLPYLAEVQRVIPTVVSRMVADASIGRHKEFIEDSARELEKAIVQAKQVLA